MSKRCHITLPDVVWVKLKVFCEMYGHKVSELAKNAIDDYIDLKLKSKKVINGEFKTRYQSELRKIREEK